MAVTDVKNLECDREEADSRMFIHAHYAAESENAGSAIVTSPDTDAAVFCLFHCSTLNFIVISFRDLCDFILALGKREGSFRCTSYSGKTFRRNNPSVACISHSYGLCDSASAPFGCGKRRHFVC